MGNSDGEKGGNESDTDIESWIDEGMARAMEKYNEEMSIPPEYRDLFVKRNKEAYKRGYEAGRKDSEAQIGWTEEDFEEHNSLDVLEHMVVLLELRASLYEYLGQIEEKFNNNRLKEQAYEVTICHKDTMDRELERTMDYIEEHTELSLPGLKQYFFKERFLDPEEKAEVLGYFTGNPEKYD